MAKKKKRQSRKKKSNKTPWVIGGVVLGIAALIDIFVPDPLVFVDEVILIAGTLFTAYKAFL